MNQQKYSGKFVSITTVDLKGERDFYLNNNTIHLSNDRQNFFKNCIQSTDLISMNNLEQIINQLNDNQLCNKYNKLLNNIYKIEFKTTQILYMNEPFKQIVKLWLNNNTNLLNKMFKQNIISITNKCTNQLNVYNQMRNYKPTKKLNNSDDSS
jgi:hypothetical protein